MTEEKLKVLLVVELTCTPEEIPDSIKAIDPPKIPHFTGQLRVVPPPYSEQIVEWLDED